VSLLGPHPHPRPTPPQDPTAYGNLLIAVSILLKAAPSKAELDSATAVSVICPCCTARMSVAPAR
jgi:hypothetical protein